MAQKKPGPIGRRRDGEGACTYRGTACGWQQPQVKACSKTSIIIIGIQPLGRSGQRPELSQATGMALVRCILGKFLGVVCHCFPRSLDVPTFHHQVPPRPPRRERSLRRKWELWARMLSGNFFAEMTTSTPFRDLLHAANLRHGTDGFTSPPKEGVLRIFSPLKIGFGWV